MENNDFFSCYLSDFLYIRAWFAIAYVTDCRFIFYSVFYSKWKLEHRQYCFQLDEGNRVQRSTYLVAQNLLQASTWKLSKYYRSRMILNGISCSKFHSVPFFIVKQMKVAYCAERGKWNTTTDYRKSTTRKVIRTFSKKDKHHLPLATTTSSKCQPQNQFVVFYSHKKINKARKLENGISAWRKLQDIDKESHLSFLGSFFPQDSYSRALSYCFQFHPFCKIHVLCFWLTRGRYPWCRSCHFLCLLSASSSYRFVGIAPGALDVK